MAGAYHVVPAASSGGTKLEGVDAVIVWAEDAATAIDVAQACQQGGSVANAAWAAGTATALAATADFEGWRLRVRIDDAPTTAVDDTVTGAASADMDAIAALMVTALNANADIAGAAYSTPNLTIAETTDGLGDLTVVVEMYPPLNDADFPDSDVPFTSLIGTITHEGSSGDALAVALDTSAPVPTLLYRMKQ